MKKTIIYILSIVQFVSLVGWAQKPGLSDTSYLQWKEVSRGIISPNGKYASYQVSSPTSKLPTFIITATNKSWKKEMLGNIRLEFSLDGKHAYCVTNGNLIRVMLSGTSVDTLDSTNDFRIFEYKSKEYLIYLNNNGSLVIHTDNAKKNTFSHVKQYWRNEQSDLLVLLQQSDVPDSSSLKCYHLSTGKMATIYSGKDPQNLIFDNSGLSIAFFTNQGSKTTIWHYSEQMNLTKAITPNTDVLEGHAINLERFFQFSQDGKHLTFQLDQNQTTQQPGDGPEVWSYQDQVIYEQYKKNNYQLPQRSTNLCVLNLENNSIKHITFNNERIPDDIYKFGEIIPIENVSIDNIGDTFFTYSLYNLRTEQREQLKGNSRKGIKSVQVSPNKKWVVYYDVDTEQLMAYNRSNGTTIAFTQDIKNLLANYNISRRMPLSGPSKIIKIHGWIENSDRLIIQGTYDLWEINLLDPHNPINLTNDGQQENRVYTLLKTPLNPSFTLKESIYIYSQDLDDKSNSLYKLKLSSKTLQHLMSGDFFWSYLYTTYEGFLKAKQAEAYLFKTPKVSESPNYFFTTNFKKLIKLSEVNPERNFNWIKSELLTYKDAVGNTCQAILYKPENFDPQKNIQLYLTFMQNKVTN
jgi:dipeptidyl aminopeptidase/acylaminoacyl peptidase